MTTGWGAVLAGLIPLALVIALSPLTVIPAVLVLQTPHPRETGTAFLTGWVAGLAALTALFVEVSGLIGGLHRTPPTWASWLRIVAGAALIGFGVYRFATRHHHTEMPGWLRRFTELTPPRAAVTAVALAVVRLEVLLVCAAAGLAIGGSGLGPTGSWTAVVVFVAASASSVAVPVLAYLAASHRLDPALNTLKAWMEQQHAALLAVTLAVIGAMVAYNGFAALELH